MRLTATIELDDGRSVEVVGVVEWQPGAVTYDSIRVESIDGEVAAGWARGEREAAEIALSWAADEQMDKEEEAA